MKVHVLTFTGTCPTYHFDVESSTTIQQLKQLLEKASDVKDSQTMRLEFKEELIPDSDLTLADYDIEDGSILELVDLSDTGRSDLGFAGTKFADVSNKNGLKKAAWGKTAPLWRIAGLGLCLEGLCTNDQCKAHQQQVIIPIGYKRFDILGDPNEEITICPICKQYVDPQTCSFNNCWWKYDGSKQDQAGKPPKKCSSDWQYADNAYHYFDQQASGTIKWKRLIIEAAKNKPKQ